MTAKHNPYRIEITTRSILTMLGILLALYGLYLIRDIVLLFFLSVLFMSVVNPFVSWLERHVLPRSVAILLVYVLVVLAVVGMSVALLPPLVEQGSLLFARLSELMVEADVSLGGTLAAVDFETIVSRLETVPRIFSVLGSTFSLLVYLMTFAMMSFYLLIERKQLHTYLIWIFGGENASEHKAEQFINEIESSMGDWSRGQLVLMVLVGVLTYLGLHFLHIPFALPLALLAGLFEVLPNIGPTLSALPSIVVALSIGSPTLALGVVAVYIIVQQVENHLLFPLVMSKAVNLHPLVTIFVVLAGYRLSGGIGAIIAIPVVLILKVSLKAYLVSQYGDRAKRLSESQKAWRRVSQILF